MRWVVVLLVACSARPAPPPAQPPHPRWSVVPPALRLPDDLTPVAYDVRLEIDPDQEDFHGEVTLHVRTTHPLSQFWLAASELEVSSGSWEGGPLQLVAQSDQMIALGSERSLPAGEHAITIAYTGHTRHDEEGLFRQKAGDRCRPATTRSRSRTPATPATTRKACSARRPAIAGTRSRRASRC